MTNSMMGYKEIAEVLGLSVIKVKQIEEAAIKKLKVILSRKEFSETREYLREALAAGTKESNSKLDNLLGDFDD